MLQPLAGFQYVAGIHDAFSTRQCPASSGFKSWPCQLAQRGRMDGGSCWVHLAPLSVVVQLAAPCSRLGGRSVSGTLLHTRWSFS